MSAKPTPLRTQAFNDVLAKMMQAEVNEGGPPPVTPCDTPVEVSSQIHMTDPQPSSPGADDTMSLTKQEFEHTLSVQLDRLRDEIHEMHAMSTSIKDAAMSKWNATIADLDAKHKAAREKLGDVVSSTGEAWGHLRDGAKSAWTDLENAVRKARSEF